MKFIIDDADFEKIKNIFEFYPVDGVTTNPSILARAGVNPYEVLKKIRNFIGYDKELHIQVISRKCDDMVKEAYKICEELGKETFIKIPTNQEGLKAIKILSKNGIKITATAIYTPMQAYLAAKCGATYVAPYVNRIDNLGFNGVEVAKKIHNIFKNNNLKTEVLAASFKNSQQVLELCEYGIGAATIGTEVIEGLIKSETISSAIDVFIEDFEKLCGENKTMLDC